MTAAASNILFKINQKIDDLELSKKQSTVSKLEELSQTLKSRIAEPFRRVLHIPSLAHASVTTKVRSVNNALREAIDAVIGTQLTNQLQEYNGMEDRNALLGRIREVKDQITQLAQTEMTKRWKDLRDVVRNAHMEIVRGIISELKSKASLLQLDDPRIADELPTVINLISDISSNTIKDLDNVDISGLVPDLDAMNLHLEASSIPDDQLNQISQRIETKYRKKLHPEAERKRGGFLGIWARRAEWSENVPDRIYFYSPNIEALKDTFSTHALNPWMRQFQVRVENAFDEMSKLVRERMRKISEDVLSAAEQKVQRALERSRQAEHNAQLMNSALIAKQHDVEEIVKGLFMH